MLNKICIRTAKSAPYPPCTVTDFWLKYQDPARMLRRVTDYSELNRATVPAQIEPPLLTVDLNDKITLFFLTFSFLMILLLILFCVHFLPICPLLRQPESVLL